MVLHFLFRSLLRFCCFSLVHHPGDTITLSHLFSKLPWLSLADSRISRYWSVFSCMWSFQLLHFKCTLAGCLYILFSTWPSRYAISSLVKLPLKGNLFWFLFCLLYFCPQFLPQICTIIFRCVFSAFHSYRLLRFSIGCVLQRLFSPAFLLVIWFFAHANFATLYPLHAKHISCLTLFCVCTLLLKTINVKSILYPTTFLFFLLL